MCRTRWTGYPFVALCPALMQLKVLFLHLVNELPRADGPRRGILDGNYFALTAFGEDQIENYRRLIFFYCESQ